MKKHTLHLTLSGGKSWKSLTMILIVSSQLLCCSKEKAPALRDEVWVPQYIEASKIKEIKSIGVQETQHGGKIYAWNTYLFQLEPLKGIHIYEIKNNKPVPHSFIQVYGAQEISIRNGVLYTNNFKDMVSLDLSTINNVKEISRIKEVFHTAQTNLPPEHGYFECVDSRKGIVIGWERKQHIHATCKY